jgi:hypothetical protein
MDTVETNAKIVETDDTMKVERTVALRDLNEGMKAGLQKLEDNYEATALEPPKYDPGPPPVMLTLSDLQLQEEAQRNAYQRMDEIFRQAKAEQEEINRDLRGGLVTKMKQDIKREALERVREFFAPMGERAKTAAATREFYEPTAVLRRARFDKSDQVHYAATASWVARLNAAPERALLGFARDAVVSASPALAALVAENIDGRGAAIPDAKAVIVTMRLPESDDGLRLIQSIIDTKANAETAMRVFQTGRPDALGKIAQGILRRAD